MKSNKYHCISIPLAMYSPTLLAVPIFPYINEMGRFETMTQCMGSPFFGPRPLEIGNTFCTVIGVYGGKGVPDQTKDLCLRGELDCPYKKTVSCPLGGENKGHQGFCLF